MSERSASPEYLCAGGSDGDIVLDIRRHALIGPAGTVSLGVGVFVLLRALLRRPNVVHSLSDLIEAAWPDADVQPDGAERAIRMRVRRARAALEKAGVSAERLEMVFLAGYRITGEQRVVRSFTRQQAAAIDRILPTLPEFQTSVAA